MTAVPEPVARIADVMSTYRPPWALAGGWAVAGWQLIGHDETKENEGADLWDGRALVPPAHLHGRPPEQSGPLPERFDDSGMRVVFSADGFWLDIQLCERSGGDWVLNR